MAKISKPTAAYLSSPLSGLTDHFLIASPALQDGLFSRSVVYVCAHGDQGALGVVINKPSPLKMEHLFRSIHKETPPMFTDSWLLYGGPIHAMRSFMIHTPVGNWQSSFYVNDKIAVPTPPDIVESLSQQKTLPFKSLATLGCSGWASGQLEEEIARNDWIITPAFSEIIFDLPIAKRYDAALQSIAPSIHSYNLISSVGHA